jgi:hypothetical protein
MRLSGWGFLLGLSCLMDVEQSRGRIEPDAGNLLGLAKSQNGLIGCPVPSFRPA